MEKYNPLISAILDYFCDLVKKGIFPATIHSQEVTWVWTAPNGHSYGITDIMAQSIMIICDKFEEQYSGGYLECIKGRGAGSGRIIL